MGLFSSKKTVVNTSVTPLIADTPNLLVDSIFASVTTDRPIAGDLLANMLGSAGSRANAYYNKAVNNHYYYGLPEGTMTLPRPYAEIVKGVIRDLHEGSPVELAYYIVSPMNPTYIAYKWLTANRAYDSVTDTLGSPPTIPDSNPNEPIEYDYAAYVSPNQIDISYRYTTNHPLNPVSAIYTERVTVTTEYGELDPDAIFYHVGYYILNLELIPVGEMQYFNYNESTDMFPPLNLDDAPEEQSTYFPVVPVCRNGEDLSVEPSDPDSLEHAIWQSCYQQLRSLGITYSDIGKALFGPFDDDVDESDKPDPDDLDYGFVILGSNIVDDRQSNLEYLSDYFKYLMVNSVYVKSDYESWKGGFFGNPTSNLATIQEGDYHVDLEYYYIEITYETGDLGGGINHYTRDIVTEISVINDQGMTIRNQTLSIRKQVSEGNIEVVTIFNPYLTTHIRGKHSAECDLDEAFNDDVAFVIPLNKEVTRNLKILVYNDLIYAAMKLVINSVTTVKVKWYQSTWFKIFSTIVITIATYVFTGPAGGLTWAALIDVAVTALVTFTIFQAISIVSTFILDLFEIENTFLATIIATAITFAALYYTGQFDTNMTNADVLLATVDSVQNGFSIASEHVMGEMMEETMKEASTHAESMKEIDEMMDAIQPPVSSDVVMESIRVGYNHFVQESPTDFIGRTTMTNPGVLAIDQVSTFTTRALNIPGVSNYNSLNII